MFTTDFEDNVAVHIFLKSSIAQWLRRSSQEHEVCCHHLKVMDSNLSRIELGVHSTSV